MRFHVANFLFEGTTKRYNGGDLVQGFNSDFNLKINQGNLLQGNLYIDGVTTPIINWWMGPAANHNYTMFTGQQEASEVGSVYAVDGDGTYIWMKNNLYTPTNGFISV